MKKVFAAMILLFCLVMTGCNNKHEITARFDSYLVNDEETYNKLTSSDALYAYEITKSGDEVTQTIYIWNNQLRRDLWKDLVEISHSLPEEDKIILVENDGVLKVKSKTIEYSNSSSSSAEVINELIPFKSYVDAREFLLQIRCMFVRLETLEKLGVTEVIALQTITSENLYLGNESTDGIVYIRK